MSRTGSKFTGFRGHLRLCAGARAIANELIGDLEPRCAHVQGVGRLAEDLVKDGVVEPQLAAAAWLHDIGYAPALAVTGFHCLDGARHLAGKGSPPSLVAIVGWQTGAAFEANERGLRIQLEKLPAPFADDLQVVNLLDLVIGPKGQPTTPT